jgi:hypothetical protein
MHDDEEMALATLASHRAIIDANISARGGKITGTAGDSVLAEFPSIIEAVNCGVSIQQALAAANADLPAKGRMELRIGINVGDVMVHDGDVFGDGVNVAARLEGLAEPGGICVSRAVRDHVRDRVAYEFEDLGEQLVKNIARPLRVFRLLFDTNDDSAELPRPPQFTRAEPSAVATSEAVEISFWHSVEAGGTPAEYRAYLERYPAGSFVPLAEARLAMKSVPEGQVQDSSVELAFWDSVKDSDDPAMFMAYLEKFPEGEFRTLAELRTRSAEAPSPVSSLSGLLRSAFSTH